MKESVKPIIERTVTAIITIGIVFAIALMILSSNLLVRAKRDQKIFSDYLENSVMNDIELESQFGISIAGERYRQAINQIGEQLITY